MTRTAAILALLSAACGVARDVSDGTPRCTSYKEDIAPLLAASCASCHTGAAPSGGYDTSTYLGVLGGGRVAVAGDRNSRLLAMIDPAVPGPHPRLQDGFEEVERWVVECQL